MASFQSDFENYSDEEENLFQPSEWEWDSEEDLEEKKANEQEDEEMAQKVKEDPEEKKEAREKEGDGEAEEGNITWTSPYPGLKENSSSDEEGGNDDAKILKKQLSLARAEISAKELNINKQAQDINRLIKRNFELIDENKEFNRNVSAKEKKMASDLEEYLIEKRALEADIQDEQEKNEQLKRKLEETKTASEGFAKVKESLQATVLLKENECARLKRELEKTKKASEACAKETKSLQTTVQHEKETNASLKRKLELFKAANNNEIAAMRKENEALGRSVSFLSDKNKRLTRELAETKNLVLEKETLEITVKKLTLVNKKQAKKIDEAKKAYSKVLVTLQKLQDTDSDSMTEDSKDTSSADSLEWTQDSSTFAQKPEDSQKTSSDKLAILKEDEAVEPSVGLLSDCIRNRTKERVDLKKAAEEKELLEAIVKKLTTDNKRQAKMLEDKDRLQKNLDSSNKAIQHYLRASEKLLAENDRLESKLAKSQKTSNNQIAALKRENETLKRAMGSVSDQNNILNRGIADFKDVVFHMSKDVFKKDLANVAFDYKQGLLPLFCSLYSLRPTDVKCFAFRNLHCLIVSGTSYPVSCGRSHHQLLQVLLPQDCHWHVRLPASPALRSASLVPLNILPSLSVERVSIAKPLLADSLRIFLSHDRSRVYHLYLSIKRPCAIYMTLGAGPNAL
uniref:Uncharacterized protein n=1 Tax=Branchiostoma floridae TaxID=7739 RepID=C3ZTR8_BRAFL|eukprot:XP_002588055.1 hypothetical protein BRAFLDRAFT_83036 [Branchiostoma floridae]